MRPLEEIGIKFLARLYAPDKELCHLVRGAFGPLGDERLYLSDEEISGALQTLVKIIIGDVGKSTLD